MPRRLRSRPAIVALLALMAPLTLGRAQIVFTDADLPHVTRLLEAWAEVGRRHRVEYEEPERYARAIDAAVRMRREVFAQVAAGTLDPLAWITTAAPRLVIPPEAKYAPHCSRVMSTELGRYLPGNAAHGARFPLPSPVALFTIGAGSAPPILTAAVRGDTAALRRLEPQIPADRTPSLAEVMEPIRRALVPTGPNATVMATIVGRWERDTLAWRIEHDFFSSTARPRNRARDSVTMTVVGAPNTAAPAVDPVRCDDLPPDAWLEVTLATSGPFASEPVLEAAEAAILSVKGAPTPSFLGSAIWEACKAAQPYGAAWIAKEREDRDEREDREERARLRGNGAWFGRHRARFEPLLLEARLREEEDACRMDRDDVAWLTRRDPS